MRNMATTKGAKPMDMPSPTALATISAQPKPEGEPLSQVPAQPAMPKTFTQKGPEGWAGLITAVECWEDAMKTRMALTLRVKGIERAGSEPPAELLIAEGFQAQAMSEFGKLIRREWRKHPLAPWAKEIKGLGEHSMAYLMAKLNGSARIAYPKMWVGENGTRALHEFEPYERTVSQLWSYCGYGDPDRKRTKGMSQEEAFACGVPLIKARLRLIAESFIKAKNEHYREVYDQERARIDKLHPDWSKGHSQNCGYRKICKEFLRDLWVAEGELA